LLEHLDQLGQNSFTLGGKYLNHLPATIPFAADDWQSVQRWLARNDKIFKERRS
jgi:hypothetical protein